MRAVIYCRVSTDEDSQVNALESQIQEAKNCIISHNWDFIDNYIDEGKSGTSTKKRSEYNRLFDDLSTSKFDVLVIKSQDRLMRNVKEWYIFVDALITNNKKLYFYLDNKFYTPDDALITGIKAILAEEFSRDLSKKIKNAHKNRQEKGKSVLITSATWGYDKVNKNVVINEKEAEVVRMIYDLCIQGYGSRAISKILTNKSIYSRRGGHFPEVTIRRIIRNPLFKGTAIMNKKSVDFDTKRMIINPKDEWKFHENIVPAIVSAEVWEEANKLMDKRSQEVHTEDFKKKTSGRNIGQYTLSSKIFCGLCGRVYWRRYRRGCKNKDEIIVDWSCSEYVRRGRSKLSNDKKEFPNKVISPDTGCDNIHIRESDLLNALAEVADRILQDKKESIIIHAMNIMKDIFDDVDISAEKDKIQKEKDKIIRQKDIMLDKLLDGTISNDDYKRRNYDLEKKLEVISNNAKTIDQKETTLIDMDDRLKDIKAILDETNMDEAKINKLIKHIVKILVFPDRLEIYFDFYDKIVMNTPLSGRKDNLYVDTDIQNGLGYDVDFDSLHPSSGNVSVYCLD